MKILIPIVLVLWRFLFDALGASLGDQLASPGVPLLADFRFDDTFLDSSALGSTFESRNTRFDHQTLFINGEYEFSGATNGCRAIAQVPGLSYSNFTVSVDVWPADFRTNSFSGSWLDPWLDWLSVGGVNRQNLRAHNAIVTAGTSYRWFGFRQSDGGSLELTLNNQDFVHRFVGVQVSTREWHHLVCSLDLGRRLIRTFLDGQALEVVHLPEEFDLEVIGSTAEPTDKQFTFTNYSDGSVFHGFVDNLRVFGRALSEGELRTFAVATSRERPVFQPVMPEEGEHGMGRPLLIVLVLLAMLSVGFYLRRNPPTVRPGA